MEMSRHSTILSLLLVAKGRRVVRLCLRLVSKLIANTPNSLQILR
jgi:hypothetical protein